MKPNESQARPAAASLDPWRRASQNLAGLGNCRLRYPTEALVHFALLVEFHMLDERHWKFRMRFIELQGIMPLPSRLPYFSHRGNRMSLDENMAKAAIKLSAKR